MLCSGSGNFVVEQGSIEVVIALGLAVGILERLLTVRASHIRGPSAHGGKMLSWYSTLLCALSL